MSLKRKLRLFCMALFSFIVLFYDNDPGLNVFIFSGIAWAVACLSGSRRLRNGEGRFVFKTYRSDRGFWLLSLSMGLTAGAFAFYGDPGSMLCLLLSAYILGIYLTDRRFHVALYPLLLAYSFGTFIVRIFFIDRWIPGRHSAGGYTDATGLLEDDAESPDPVAANTGTTEATSTASAFFWVRTWLVPLCIALLFLLVYMASSSTFADILIGFLPQLNFRYLFILLLLGFFLLFNFLYILPIPWLYTINEKLSEWNTVDQNNLDGSKQPRAAARQKAAIITFSLLISLLTAFLLVYGYELYRGIHEARLSRAVHEQINSIILSIVMAVAVILYYIRPEGPHKAISSLPPLLRKLAFGWVGLNVLLVISAAMHNAVYIQRYGLTLLRVGVYIFLLLAITGLYFTYRKIKDRRTAGYLISVMFKIFFGTIVLNSLINWSAVVTRYNLHFMDQPDMAYLKSLDYNAQILYPVLTTDPTRKQTPSRKGSYPALLKDNVSNKASTPILSAALYFRYANWRLQQEP